MMNKENLSLICHYVLVTHFEIISIYIIRVYISIYLSVTIYIPIHTHIYLCTMLRENLYAHEWGVCFSDRWVLKVLNYLYFNHLQLQNVSLKASDTFVTDSFNISSKTTYVHYTA